MRKIYITEEQEKILAGGEAPQSMPDFVSDGAKNGGTPVSNSDVIYGDFLLRGVQNRYREILGFFNDDITSYPPDKVFNELSRLIAKCRKKEMPIKERLETLCYNKVSEELGLQDGVVDLVCELTEIPEGASFHIKPDTDESEYEDISSIESEASSIEKRRIINCMLYGASSRIAEIIMGDILKDIFDLDEELPHLYSKIMKINEYLVFINDVKIEDKDHKQGGTVEVEIRNDDEIPSVKAKGLIFPILLQETVSGLLELISTNGLPDDSDAARKVLNVGDAIENEPWNMRIGHAFWDPISALTNVEVSEVPYLFSELVTDEDFLNTIHEFTAKTKTGKQRILDIYNRAKYAKEYEGFENDIAVKRKDNVLTDAYFTEEELMGGIENGAGC